MHTIDHLFVFCRPDAPEQQRLTARGLAVGVRREHAGQGTKNVCFGFADSYLELLWLADEQAARDPHVKPLGLQERARWRDSNASPFGICVRPATAGAEPPFAHWDYRPRYLPAGMTLRMACNSGVIGEPMLFEVDRAFVPFAQPHPLAQRRLARAVVTVRDLAPMSLLRELDIEALTIRDGPEPLLELEFDGGAGEVLDLRPDLPVVLRW